MSAHLLAARLENRFPRVEKTQNSMSLSRPLTPPETPPEEVPDILQRREAHDPEHLFSPQCRPIVAVIGVGYVGFHLVETFAKTHRVTAFDVSESRLREVASRFKGLPVTCTSSPADLSAASYFLIAVPTILNHDKSVDTTYLQSAVATIEQYARPGSTIVVESSVAVGMTRSLLARLAASKGFKVGMSPERVDPGRKSPSFESVPKVISGLDDASLESIYDLYRYAFETVVPVSSPEVAEMTKLYENCQRMLCAAYANEMADACFELGIDPWEVSKAAASKPFGYLPFSPGAGIGGHCIPINPYYLLSTSSMPILQHATEVSGQRPSTIADRFMYGLGKHQGLGKTQQRHRILVVGMGFKRGQSVLSNSPGVAIVVRLLSEWETYVEFADPLVKQEALSYVPRMDPEDWNKEYLERFDGIIVAINQTGLDIELLDSLEGVQVQNYSPSTV